jgi:hypothetical protein
MKDSHPQVTASMASARSARLPIFSAMEILRFARDRMAGIAPDPNVVWWQDRLTPIWKCVGGGCHLKRPVAQFIEGAAFRFERFETGYMRGPKPMTFMYEGSARPR